MTDQLNAWLALDKARTAELLRIVDATEAMKDRVVANIESVHLLRLPIIEEVQS